MRHKIRKLLFAGALSLWSCLASAAPMLYEFSTVLKLNVGPDTYGLNGAAMHFAAEIADGTVWKPDIFSLGFKTFDALSHQWTISGSGSVDGYYADPNGATFAGGFGWAGLNGAPFNFAPFDTAFPYLVMNQAISNVQYGDLVLPENFGVFSVPGAPTFGLWRTNDDSMYTWFDNAHFSVTEVSAVPAPSTLALMSIALGFAAWFSTKQRLSQQTSLAA